MRVLTFNVWGRSEPWTSRRELLQRGLARLAPDLVAFQESVHTSDYHQTADMLGPNFDVLEQEGRHPDGTGISIASRWPIQRTQEVDLHVTARTGDFPCATLIAEVVVPEPVGRVVFVNHHGSWELAFEHERELQAVVAARAIAAFAGPQPAHVIIAGDLNADPGATSIRFWTGRAAIDGLSVCYRDAWESAHPDEAGHTFASANPLVPPNAPDWPFRRIDYILVGCGEHAGSTLSIDDCELAFTEPVNGVWASDHFGVVADLGARPANRT